MNVAHAGRPHSPEILKAPGPDPFQHHKLPIGNRAAPGYRQDRQNLNRNSAQLNLHSALTICITRGLPLGRSAQLASQWNQPRGSASPDIEMLFAWARLLGPGFFVSA